MKTPRKYYYEPAEEYYYTFINPLGKNEESYKQPLNGNQWQNIVTHNGKYMISALYEKANIIRENIQQ